MQEEIKIITKQRKLFVQEVAKYCWKEIQPKLKLQNWDITFAFEFPESKTSIADIELMYGREVAIIRLSEKFHELNSFEQRESLTREYLHCIFAPIDMPLQHMMESRQTLEYCFQRSNLEYAVDKLATIIAPNFKLPKFITYKDI